MVLWNRVSKRVISEMGRLVRRRTCCSKHDVLAKIFGLL